MGTCYHFTSEARAALQKAKDTKDPEARLSAMLAATENLADAMSRMNREEEVTYRNLERRHLGR